MRIYDLNQSQVIRSVPPKNDSVFTAKNHDIVWKENEIEKSLCQKQNVMLENVDSEEKKLSWTYSFLCCVTSSHIFLIVQYSFSCPSVYYL